MSARRDRIAGIARQAEDDANRALARWAEAAEALRGVDRERDAMLERASRMAGTDLTAGLRGHLAAVGARHLVAVTEQKAVLTERGDTLRTEYDAARTRLQSLERMVERLDESESLRRRRRDEAEQRDLVAARITRGRP